MMAAIGLALLCGGGLLFAAQASQQPPAARQQQTIRAGVSVVNLFATVRDKDRRIVADLTQAEFRVFEDGREQKVEFFSRELNLPLTMGLLVDTSPSQGAVLGAEQEAAVRFLHRVMRKGDLTFIASFDSEVDLLSEFTEDLARLERAVMRARMNAGSPRGIIQGPFPTQPRGTRFYDAVYLGCTEKLAREAGRKALVVLTDGQDQGSQMKLEEAVEACQQTNTVIHIILIADPQYYRGFYEGTGAAKKICDETGGRMIEVRNEKKLEEAFDQITEELRSQYTLGYYPENTSRDGKFRKVKVETKRKDTRVLARKGYYAPGS
jgi:VWFA-related protein